MHRSSARSIVTNNLFTFDTRRSGCGMFHRVVAFICTCEPCSNMSRGETALQPMDQPLLVVTRPFPR